MGSGPVSAKLLRSGFPHLNVELNNHEWNLRRRRLQWLGWNWEGWLTRVAFDMAGEYRFCARQWPVVDMLNNLDGFKYINNNIIKLNCIIIQNLHIYPRRAVAFLVPVQCSNESGSNQIKSNAQWSNFRGSYYILCQIQKNKKHLNKMSFRVYISISIPVEPFAWLRLRGRWQRRTVTTNVAACTTCTCYLRPVTSM